MTMSHRQRILAAIGAATGACAIAVPAALALSHNPSFGERIPVNVPSSAHVVSFDNHGGVIEVAHRHRHGVGHPKGRHHDDPTSSMLPSGTASEPGDDRSSTEPEPGDDHGGQTRPGDDRDRQTEPGDDRSSTEAEPGDDHGGQTRPGDDSSSPVTHTREPEPGDDHGGQTEPGDDHSGSGKSSSSSGSGSDDNSGHDGGDDHRGRGGHH